MSYAKTIYFIPVWFDDLKHLSAEMDAAPAWAPTDSKKIKPGYLFHYAANIADDRNLFASYSLRDTDSLRIYMYEDEISFRHLPQIEDVRFSCFATGVGFLEFWVSYTEMTAEEITNFAYLFKKAAKRNGKKFEDGKQSLYHAAESILPAGAGCQIFFSASASFKYECNCAHFIHVDEEIPDSARLKDTLSHLCRSYKSTMNVSFAGAYDMTYEASPGDYWGGSTEGIVNLVYDPEHNENDPSYAYLHAIKPMHLNVDYYFLYLLLLNQKYAALQYIYMVSQVIDKPSRYIETLNKRIIQLKNVFSFNIVSDDLQFQNIYAKMFAILEIKNLLEDVIENENQTEFLQNAKHANADRLSNKYLFGISVLSLFSALIDSASYFDRIDGIQSVSTLLSLVSVSLVFVLCVAWAIKSIHD